MGQDERRRGRLVAFEGVDGCGKSTQARLLAKRLGALLTFEPGDTALGASIRRLILGFEGSVSVRAEALLVAADRAQHVEEIVEPVLAGGRWVVSDRYSGSTLAYQGWGHGLGEQALEPVLDFATGGLSADLSILLDVPLEVAHGRISAHEPDRLERLDAQFHQRVAAGYRELARSNPTSWALIEGTGKVEEIAGRVAAAVRDRLGEPSDR